MRSQSRTAVLAAGLLLSVIHSATASTLVFTGQNAALFDTANPADTSALMLSVVRPNNPATAAAEAGATSPASLIEQSVESQISAKINDDIFNGTAPSGSFDLGGGNLINYVRAGGNIIINITDPTNGQTTITVPDL